MLFGFNLNDLFMFPLEAGEARKYFLIGCLIYLAGFFIPILPWLITSGYSAIIIRQILNGEKPHLVSWDNWEALFKDGARLLGIGLAYTLPFLVLMILFFIIPFFSIALQSDNSQGRELPSLIFILASVGISIVFFPLSLAIGLIVPVAEVHAIAKDDFMAGFRVKEWWPIFTKNWSGFVVALAILYGLIMVTSFAMQFLFITIILICVFPILMAVVSMYYSLVQFAMFAQAYKDGKDKLNVESKST